jgi:hypothetical protein
MPSHKGEHQILKRLTFKCRPMFYCYCTYNVHMVCERMKLRFEKKPTEPKKVNMEKLLLLISKVLFSYRQ